ncbi:MAG TPA: cellulase family glycosylhydrolase [Thermoleophilaceae bacterium]|nr:cellulase family glycosylhydrolase [Thermoleophilaceae bacterium]
MNAFACSLALSAGIAFTGPPAATERVETVLQDDAALLYRSPAQVRRSLRRMAALGVDRVRITASWYQLAPARDQRRRPSFDAADPNAYDRATLGRLDRAVNGARAEGMKVMIDLGFFAPRWAVTRGGENGRNVWRPSVREYRLYSRAMARRYRGKVRLWTTWNEPNHRVFLRPQWVRSGDRWRPVTPHLYRRLHNAAYDQVKAVSGRNRVLIGGLSSFGDPGRGPARGLAPLRFTRELACVDSSLRPLRRPECRGFRALRADGFALHPYSLDTPPDALDPAADRVQIGELAKLTSLLAGLERRGRVARPLPLYLTEYGYQTDPPDPGKISQRLAGRYQGEALWLGWRAARTRMFPQFLLYDIGPDRSKPAGSAARWGGYQTGLYTYDGRPKTPVVRGFRLPFQALATRDERGAGGVAVFGQVRPRRGTQTVEIQRQGPDGSWATVPSRPVDGDARSSCGTFATDGQGLYRRVVADQGPGRYRARWHAPGGRVQVSPPAAVGAPVAVPGGATGALRRLADDGRAPAG